MAALASFRDRGVLVTGASSGIGRRLALRAAQDGARLVLVARRLELLESAVREALDAGAPEAFALACDLGVCDEALRTARRAEELLGGVDVLVHSAGFGRHRAFVDHDVDDLDRLVRVNLLGAAVVTHALAPRMIERGHGFIVFVASVAGLLPVPGESVYSASKFGLVGLAEALSIELEPHGVHVLTVCPGAVRTDFVPPEELARMPEAAHRTMIEPGEVVEATVRALRAGSRRVIVPRGLSLAVALRGPAPDLVRWGTARATRSVLAKDGGA